MSDKVELNAEPRSDLGKGASRRLRKTGMVPAIIYGSDAEPTSISLPHNELSHELENEAFYTQVLTLNIGKNKEDVILRDLQRHPFKPVIMHADFLRIDKNKTLHITVPIHFANEETCHGVKMEGGMLNRLTNDVEISALPKNLPEYLELDVAELKLGETLHLSDIKCPEGVEIIALTHEEDEDHDYDLGVASVIELRKEAEPAAESAEAEEATASDGGEATAEE